MNRITKKMNKILLGWNFSVKMFTTAKSNFIMSYLYTHIIYICMYISAYVYKCVYICLC